MHIRPFLHVFATVSVVAAVVMMPVAATAAAQSTGTKPPVRIPIKPGTPGAPDIAKLPKSPKVPETFEGLFAERDARSVDAIGYFRCMQATVDGLRSGALGNVPQDWSITCVQQKDGWRGVFGQLTDNGMDVKLQIAYRDGKPTLTTDAVDTALVNGTARALLRGLSAPLPGDGTHQFTPVPLAQKGFVEVWFLPVPSDPTKAIVGGDSLIQMSANGSRELGHGRTTPPVRAMPVPLSGTSWTLPSIEERIPSVSELMLAHMALDLVPEVRIRTNQYESVLTRTAKGWTHHRR